MKGSALRHSLKGMGLCDYVVSVTSTAGSMAAATV